jgi:hypothetical protein
MLAHAFLAAVTAAEHARHPAVPGLTPLTLSEIRRLFTRLISGVPLSVTDLLEWSHWRRRHQARARLSHYRRQAVYET